MSRAGAGVPRAQKKGPSILEGPVHFLAVHQQGLSPDRQGLPLPPNFQLKSR